MTLRATAVLAAVVLSAAEAEPVRLHPKNPHYFLFRGKAVALVTSAEHYGAVPNGAFDYQRYLAARAVDGMSYARVLGGSYVEVPSKFFGIRRNTLAPGPRRLIAPRARSETWVTMGWNDLSDCPQRPPV